MATVQRGTGSPRSKPRLVAWVAASMVAAAMLSVSVTSFADEQKTESAAEAPNNLGARSLDLSVRSADQQSVEDYWTKERMENATPLEERKLERSDTPNRQKLDSSVDGDKQLLDGVIGNLDTVKAAPNTSFIGKVFTTLNGKNFIGSGVIVVSDSHDLVVTAAHVIYSLDDSQFVENMMFVPGYDDGNAPFGKWTAQKMSVLKQWSDNAPNHDDYDIGLARMRPNDDTNIQDVAGASGICFNCRKDAGITAYGYPGATDNGQRLVACLGTTEPEGEHLIIRDCPAMTGGASGGPWLLQSDDSPTLVSLNNRTGEQVVGGLFFDGIVQSFYESFNKAEL